MFESLSKKNDCFSVRNWGAHDLWKTPVCGRPGRPRTLKNAHGSWGAHVCRRPPPGAPTAKNHENFIEFELIFSLQKIIFVVSPLTQQERKSAIFGVQTVVLRILRLENIWYGCTIFFTLWSIFHTQYSKIAKSIVDFTFLPVTFLVDLRVWTGKNLKREYDFFPSFFYLWTFYAPWMLIAKRKAFTLIPSQSPASKTRFPPIFWIQKR